MISVWSTANIIRVNTEGSQKFFFVPKTFEFSLISYRSCFVISVQDLTLKYFLTQDNEWSPHF